MSSLNVTGFFFLQFHNYVWREIFEPWKMLQIFTINFFSFILFPDKCQSHTHSMIMLNMSLDTVCFTAGSFVDESSQRLLYSSCWHRLSPDQQTGKVTQHIQFDAFDVNEFEYKINMWVVVCRCGLRYIAMEDMMYREHFCQVGWVLALLSTVWWCQPLVVRWVMSAAAVIEPITWSRL